MDEDWRLLIFIAILFAEIPIAFWLSTVFTEWYHKRKDKKDES